MGSKVFGKNAAIEKNVELTNDSTFFFLLVNKLTQNSFPYWLECTLNVGKWFRLEYFSASISDLTPIKHAPKSN